MFRECRCVRAKTISAVYSRACETSQMPGQRSSTTPFSIFYLQQIGALVLLSDCFLSKQN